MSYLLEALGRGLLTELRSAFDNQLPALADDNTEQLSARWSASPSSFDLAMRLGMSYLGQMRLSEARRTFEAACHIPGATAQPRLGLACVHDELGQIDQAIVQLSAAQEADPRDPAISFALGFCHERLGRAAEAKAAYAQAVELCPQLRNAYERMAAIAIRERDWDTAARQYEQLAELEPGDLDILLTLGNLYLELRRPADAIAHYQQALLIEPDGPDSDPVVANQIKDEGRLVEAIQNLERLVHKYPGMAPFHVRLGDLYAQAGNDTRALEQYQTALLTQPGFLEATVKLGTQHMRQGRFIDAAVTFNRAVELNDRLITAFAGLGVAQHECGRTQEALASFDLATSLEPSSTLLYSEATRLQLQSELTRRDPAALPDDGGLESWGADDLLDEALRRHEQALLSRPNHADLHYRYGLLLRQVGRLEEALQAFRNAVTINPSYCKALVKLGVALKEAGEADEAVKTFQQALRLNAKFVDLHYQLGLLFSQRNQFDLAVEEFEQAVAGSPKNAEFRAHLALALQSIGMVDRAAAVWHALCDLSPVNETILAAREAALRNAQRS
jgi:tetratricopeptide (TPR) repeat protein